MGSRRLVLDRGREARAGTAIGILAVYAWLVSGEPIDVNAIEKFYALLVSDAVNVWHFPAKKESPRFFYWLASEPEMKDGHSFDTLEEMIEAAYSHIDPMKKPLPDSVEIPPQAEAVS